MKKILSLIISLILVLGIVGCNKKEELDTTKYFETKNEEVIKGNKNYEYKEMSSLETSSTDKFKDEKVKMVGKVKDLELNDKTLEMWLEIEKNNTPYPLRVIIPSTMVNTKFLEGYTITVYGRFAGLTTKTHNDKKINYWQLSAYFIEKGDTTANTNTEAVKQTKENTNKEETTENKSSTQTSHKSRKGNTNKKSNKKESTSGGNYDNKDELPGGGYYTHCKNGHKIYTVNGDYDCGKCQEEWEKEQENEPGFIKDGTGLGEKEWNKSDEPEEHPDSYYE